jgi:hypothetical protein
MIKMSIRVYVLLDIVDGSSDYVLQVLRGKAGIVLADRLDGHPDIITIVEAPDRQRLAEVLMPIIGCIDGIAEDLHLLVTRDNELLHDHSTSRNSRYAKERIGAFREPGLVV